MNADVGCCYCKAPGLYFSSVKQALSVMFHFRFAECNTKAIRESGTIVCLFLGTLQK